MALKILIIDDDFINRKLLQTLLKRKSDVVEIFEAENGSDALDQVKKHSSINFILLDIVMPIVDGIEFLKIYRSNKLYAETPVIILSTDDTRKAEALELGANDFIRKPIKEKELFDKISRWT